jgi:predicted RNA-binding protein with PUA-like domain
MPHWLMKSEPSVFSIDDLKRLRRETWDGVRNYQARNYLRQMAVGDEVLFYHSSCAQPGVVGLAKISRTAFPDPTQFDPDSRYFDPGSKPEDPRWSAVEVEFVEDFPAVIALDALKRLPDLAELPLLRRGNRLSVMPVTPEQFAIITAMAATRTRR